MTNTRIKYICAIGITLLVVLIVGVWLFTHASAVRQSAAKLSLIPKEEHFTEIYFEDPQQLPRLYMPRKTQEFSFTIHNLEDKDMDYAYQAYFIPAEISSTSTALLKRETLHVPKNGYVAKKIAYTLDGKILTKDTVVVRLPELKQEIHFIVTK